MTLPALQAELGDEDELVVVDNASRTAPRKVARAGPPGAADPQGQTPASPPPATGGSGRRGTCSSSSTPTRRRWPASARRFAGRWSRGEAGPPGRRSSPTAAGTRINSAGNPVHFTGIVWAGSHGRPSSRRPGRRGPRPVGRLSRDPEADLDRGGRVPGAVLPLPRGRRPLAAPAALGRKARDRAPARGRPQLRVRRTRTQVALAGAQPLGIPDPHLPQTPSDPDPAGPDRDRAGADRRSPREVGADRSSARSST